MAEKTIMLACAAGMSTSLLVTKMQKSAEERGIDAEIFAVSTSEVAENVEEKNIDVVLLGPQVRFMYDEFKESLGQKGIPVSVIPIQDYGLMNGEKVLDLALSLMEEA